MARFYAALCARLNRGRERAVREVGGDMDRYGLRPRSLSCMGVVVLCAWLPLSTSCYVMHLAGGQLAMVNGQVPLHQAVEREKDAERRALLEEVIAIRAFAEEVVGMPPSDSYVGYYEVDRHWLTMILSAAPRDKLVPYTRWYPVAGRVPYRSFFDESRAEKAEAELIAAGYDTFLHASPAYSTLGFFRDPVTTPMLERSPPCPPAQKPRVPDPCRVAGLAETLIHELTHQYVYVKGRSDFNERLASFVGRTAMLQYLSSRGMYDEEVEQRLETAFARQKLWEHEVQLAAEKLRVIYDAPTSLDDKLARRQPVFEALAQRGAEVFPGKDPSVFMMNNARVLQYLRYDRGADEFKAAYDKAGQRWSRFWPLIRAKAKKR